MPRPPRRKITKANSARTGAALPSSKTDVVMPKRNVGRLPNGTISKQQVRQVRGSSLVLVSEPIDVSTRTKSREPPGSQRSTRKSSIITAPESVMSSKSKQSRRKSARPQSGGSSMIHSSRTRRESVNMARDRQRTPSVQPSMDSDLYGLSPEGEISRAKIEAVVQAPGSKRTSLARPPSALKVRGTPGLDTSILAAHNFKRRARKPSIMQSMLNTAQNSEVEDNLDLSLELPSDDFAPVDESTPLNKRKTRSSGPGRRSTIDITASSSGRKRKFEETVSQNAQTRISSPPLSSPRPASEESSLPEHRIAQTVERHDEEPVSDVMAPPMSSSSADVSPAPVAMTTSQESNVRKRLKAFQPSTKQLEQLLPRPRTTRRLARNARPTPKDTLDLTDSSEVSSVLDSDDTPVSSIEVEEVAPVGKRSTRSEAKNTTRKNQKTPARPVSVASKRATKSRAAVLTESKSKANTRRIDRERPITVASRGKGSEKNSERRRTYGNRSINLANKENADEDNSFQPNADESTVLALDIAGDKMLAKMRNKFAEVDHWEMEFESVEGGDSSSWR